MKQMVMSLFGMFGSAVALLFGGWDIALQTLVLFIAFWTTYQELAARNKIADPNRICVGQEIMVW